MDRGEQERAILNRNQAESAEPVLRASRPKHEHIAVGHLHMLERVTFSVPDLMDFLGRKMKAEVEHSRVLVLVD